MKKPIDLSVRPPKDKRPPIPSFYRQERTNGTLSPASASLLDIFNPNGACTVQWISLQTQTAISLQLYMNGLPFGLAVSVPASTILQFPGLLLPNNAKLSLSLSGAGTVTYEVVWIKAFEPDLIVKDLSVSQVGATSITGTVTVTPTSSDAPLGTETATIIRDIFRKKQILQTSTPLGANATFTGPWQDSELTGTNYVEATGVANVASAATSGIQLQESDDQITANVNTVANGGSSTINYIAGNIRKRYWRVLFTNGATLQTSFTLYTTEASLPLVSGFPLGNTENVSVTAGNSPTNFQDGLSNASASLIASRSTAGGLQGNVCYEFNGTTFDRPRGNWNTTTGDSGAKVASFVGATQTNFDSQTAIITAIISAVSGTTPTLTAQLQYSPDGGTTWINLGAASTALTAAGQIVFVVSPTLLTGLTTGGTSTTLIASPLPRTWRLNYTIAGTTPSFTFTGVYVNYNKG